MADWIGIIEKDPNKRGGRPRIVGYGITVEDVALAYRGAMGRWSVERIAKEFDLPLGKVHAALAYYYENKEEIDQAIRDGEAREKEILRGIPSVREGIVQVMAQRPNH